MKFYIWVIYFMTALPITAQEKKNDSSEAWFGNRPDGHGPISIMGDHTHGKGEFMLSYRYMHMNMEDLNQRSQKISSAEAIVPNTIYQVTPIKMLMNIHMLGGMYAPSDRITLMGMVNYISQEMNHVTAMGGVFTTNSSGFGDTKIAMLYRFFRNKRQQFHGQLGISVPTGSISERDVTPASAANAVQLPYPMQIGSGTWDPELALTYVKQWNTTSFGSQVKTVIRLGENSNVYRLGNSYKINNWFALKVADWISLSSRMEFGAIENISGVDPNLNPNFVTTADTTNLGKTYANAGLGLNLYAFKGNLKDLRLGAEVSLPIFQNVNGIQLRMQEMLVLGIQYVL